MDKKQLQKLVIILPIVLIAGIFVYYKYLILPLNAKRDALKTELENIKREYSDSVARAARLPKLQEEIIVLNNEISDIEKRLPKDKDLPNLIRMLSKKMDLHRVTWSKLSPGTQNVKDYYIEHSYTIPFKVSYHDFAEFLSDVGQMERRFATRFSRLATTTGNNGITLVMGDLTFLIYTSK